MMNEKWFALSVQQIEQKLKTNAALGLSRKAARSRAGKNQGSVFVSPHQSVGQMIGRIFSDFIFLLLLLTSVLSLFFEEYRTGWVLVALIGINVGISLSLYCFSVRQTEAFAACFYPKTKVIRNGKLFLVAERELVPGDVILIEKGDILCCDARLINSDRLRVRMRVDREHYTELEKFSDGFVPPATYHPTEMTNMVHAGSVVQDGSARAIVTATGKYTYLGAMTNGILLPFSDRSPKSFIKIQKNCAKYHVILLLAVLPICLIGLLVSHSFGGNVLLSTAFLTLLSTIATGISQTVCRLCDWFYVKEMRRLLVEKNPAAVRSLQVFEQLQQMDYLFVLDDAVLHDGVYHFQSACCAEGEIRNFGYDNASVKFFCEMVAVYSFLNSEALGKGSNDVTSYQQGIHEFLNKIRMDFAGLRFRYRQLSYLPGNLNTDEEKICLGVGNEKIWLSVSSNPQSLTRCTHALVKGKKRAWSSGEKNLVLAKCQNRQALRNIPLIFTLLSENGTNQDACFIGMLSLGEEMDLNCGANIRQLERDGCRVIRFFSPKVCSIGEKAAAAEHGACKEDFSKRRLPLTYGFGRFDWYSDFDENDLVCLIRHAHAQKKTVALIGQKEIPSTILSCADFALTCFSEQEQGQSFSEAIGADCMQTVKMDADVLLPRPSKGRAGLSSLQNAIGHFHKASSASRSFLQYVFSAQILRLAVVVLPMLFGQSLIDARHILFFGYIMDFAAFACFLNPIFRPETEERSRCTTQSGQSFLLGSWYRLAVLLGSALLVLVLPYIAESVGFFGSYLYRTEFAFTAMIFLHLVVLISWRYPTARSLKHITHDYLLWGEGIGILLFEILCYTSFVGTWFSIEKNPLPYFVLSVVPSVCFMIFMYCPNFKKMRRGRTNPPRKNVE